MLDPDWRLNEVRHHAGRAQGCSAHARRLEELGVDGAFTFEGPHDVFTPLILAAEATRLLSSTNVAIAFPRNRCSSPTRPMTSSCFPEGDSPWASVPR